MARVFWTDEESATLRELIAQGVGYMEIARQLGRTPHAVSQRIQRLKREASGQPAAKHAASVPVNEMNAMAQSAGAVRQPQAPQVKSHWLDDDDITEEWERAEQSNAKHIAKAIDREKFSVDFPADEPIAVAFVSDQHIAKNAPVDLARMRADAEYIRDTPNLFALLLGDGIDNHIKHRAAVIASGTTPGEQYRLFEFYLSIFAPKILAMASGNHDHWTKQFAGVDVLDYLAEKQRICYCPHAYTINVTVGGQSYVICGRHQYRYNSSFNQGHAPKQMWRMGEVDFDIAGIGHHHEPAVESVFFRGIERWVCRPGSYQITSDYSRQYGFNSAYSTCPTFVLYPRTRDIVGFSNMRKAGQFLRGMLR